MMVFLRISKTLKNSMGMIISIIILRIASIESVRTDSLKMGFKFLGCYPNTRN